jgi:PilZ domain
MSNVNGVVWSSSPPQERKYRRFQLQYPVRLKVRHVDLIVEFEAVSKNISICGLLLETSSMIPQHTPVSFTVTVDGRELDRPIRFVGEGKVVRVDRKLGREVLAIAVECAQPIQQIDHCLEATGS